jgi:GDPmannose 4,6-dehydratase
MMTNPKRALLTGITGQDGSYLTEFLLEKGYEVHGTVRRSSNFNTARIDHVYKDPHESDARIHLHYADLNDGNGLARIIHQVRPTEVYNLGAQSHVRVSFDQPIYTADTTGVGALKLLEAVRDFQEHTGYQIRFYQASSSEMFGNAQSPQSETTPFHPRSPYGAAKVYAHWITSVIRESYGLHASCGILFNHESPRRGETFVTRKITRAVGRIKHGLQDRLYLGNLDAKRDWGFAGDFVAAMWRMLQEEDPDDYVIATGVAHSVREFCELAFACAELDYEEFVRFDDRYLRPAEVDVLTGDSSKARQRLNWAPKVSFDELVSMMIEADMELAAREKTLIQGGHGVSVPAERSA